MSSATPGADRATVKWARNDGDCATPVESYTVTDHPSGNLTMVPNTLDASGIPTIGVVILLDKGVHSFTVVANNAVGPSAAANTNTVTVGGPGKPSRPTASPSNAAAVLEWRKPANGQSPITGFRVTPRKNGVAGPSTTFAATALSGTVHGLQNAHVYTFTVQAVNAYGPGPSSPASNPVTVGVPLAPVNLHATPAGTGSIKVAFSESGRSNGAAITKFAATCTATGGATKTVTRAGASTAAITVSGVTTSRVYRCRVRATNSRGTGVWSKPSNLVRT